eukprot:5004145-Pyramimonas_sp.AAC.1
MSGQMFISNSTAYDPPSDEMRASIHARFIEQCRKPKKLEFICQLYDLSTDKLGEGVRTHELAHISD